MRAELSGYAENIDTRCLNSKSESRNSKQIRNSNVLMSETNTPSCIIGTEPRMVQFRSFGFRSFDIVSNFGFRDSFFCLWSDTYRTPMGIVLKPPPPGVDSLISDGFQE